ERVEIFPALEHLLTWGLQNEGAVGQRLVVQQFPEAVEPDVALADVDVPVSLAAERDGRVVAVAGADALRRAGAGELIQCRPHPVRAGVVVARSIDMGSIDRDTQAGRMLRCPPEDPAPGAYLRRHL